MLVRVTKDRGQEKWYKKGQIYVVFTWPQAYDEGPAYQVVGYNGGISLKDCEYLNEEDPLKYVQKFVPENGLTPIKEFLDEYAISLAKDIIKKHGYE